MRVFKLILMGVAFCLATASAYEALASYRSLLKKSTRSDRVYVWDNLEARVIWNATYLSENFRKARLDRLADLNEWTAEERSRAEREDRDESKLFDVFFLGVYAGSSAKPEIGKDTGKWKIVLEAQDREPVSFTSLERIPVTQMESSLYPYLDKWSEAFLVKFPKMIEPDQGFHLRMTGIPAKSELVWK